VDEITYSLPKLLNLEGYINTVNEIPIINSPAVFGLHPNAEIMYYTNAAKDLWDNLLSLQTSGSSSHSQENKVMFVIFFLFILLLVMKNIGRVHRLDCNRYFK